jgi:glycosyltransferase
LSEKRILFSDKDNGIYDALNKGLKMSSGELIGILHSDDVLSSSSTISKIVEIFEKDRELKILYGNLLYTDFNFQNIIREWRSMRYFKLLLFLGWMPAHPTVYIKKDVLKELKKYNEEYSISGDYDFLIRLFKLYGHKSYYLNSELYLMRIGGKSNSSLKNILKKTKEDFKIIQRNNLASVITLLLKNTIKIPQFFLKKQNKIL